MANRFDDKVMSVSKALTILEELSKVPAGLGLLEISARVGMNKTTVYRLLTSLMEKDFVGQDEMNGKYSLGMKILSLAGSFYEKKDIRVVVRKHIKELKDICQCFILTVKEMNEEYLVIDSFDFGLPCGWNIGASLDGEGICGSIIRADRMFWQHRNSPLPSSKGVGREDLYQELKVVALQGYGIGFQGEEGRPCIAAPVFNYSKNLECVIGVFSPEIEDEKIQSEVIHALLEVTGRISNELGFHS